MKLLYPSKPIINTLHQQIAITSHSIKDSKDNIDILSIIFNAIVQQTKNKSQKIDILWTFEKLLCTGRISQLHIV